MPGASREKCAESGDARRFLQDPATHGGAAPERLETHISRLFLTEDRAYKLKKPVSLGFLDFSTLQRREQACRHELAVNRRFTDDLYLGLRQILALPGGDVAFGPLLTEPDAVGKNDGGAQTLDWVVEMRRFDKGGEFDKLADADALTPHLMRALADCISASHCAAPRLPADQRGAAPLETIEQIATTLARTPVAEDAAQWAEQARRAHSPIAWRLNARRRHGFPRRLHGDLHLGNICLLNGEPTPFDAIEFDDAIATVDPLYDVAFTVMDLIWRQKAWAGQVFLSRYLAATRDYGGLFAWPLFLSLRAAIRAMTAMLAEDERLAREKLAFARQLLSAREAEGGAPRLLVIGGMSGTGKSTLAAGLAPRLAPLGDAVSLSSDVTRKRMFGRTPEQALRPQHYTPQISELVFRRLAVDAGRALRAGASVVLDGVYGRRSERDRVQALAERIGARFDGLWLSAPLEERLARVDQRAAAALSDPRRADPSDADRAVAEAQAANLEKDETGWRRLNAGAGPSETLAQAAELLGLDLGG